MSELPEVTTARALEHLLQLRTRQNELKAQLEALQNEIKIAAQDALKVGARVRRVCEVAGVSSRTLYLTWGIAKRDGSPSEQVKQPAKRRVSTKKPATDGTKRRQTRAKRGTKAGTI